MFGLFSVHQLTNKPRQGSRICATKRAPSAPFRVACFLIIRLQRGVKGIRICLEMPFLSRKGFCFTRLYGNRYLLVSLVRELGAKRRKTGGLQELPRCSLARLGGEKVGRRLASLALYTLHSGAVLRGSVQRVLSFHRQPSRLASKQSTSRIETPTSSLGASPSDRKGSQLDHSPLSKQY
jgi:hypothetical protein